MNSGKWRTLSLIFAPALFVAAAQAHHSFAAFDTDTKIEKSGILTDYRFGAPHITMELEVASENGEKTTWHIESLVPRRWNSMDLDRDFVKVGDAITIIGWPARDGSAAMMLSAIVAEHGTLTARDEIRQ